jgi:hypothetical protein
MPQDGSITLTLGFWTDETTDEITLYANGLELVEAS